MFVLTPAHQAYAWGSTEAIQQFAGYGASGEPLAEIWFGAHPAGRATLPDGRALADYIAEDPARVLGEQVAADFDGQLPFLVKLLAPGQAVSLQVHPSAARAAEAFAAEAKTHPAEPKFVDANHKPEMIFALTDFEGLVGLRPADEAAAVLTALRTHLAQTALQALEARDDDALREAVRILTGASADDVTQAVEAAKSLADGGDTAADAAATLLELEGQYPGDAGALVSLMLRRVRLAAGESVMVHSGVPHAYMSGLALEVMANSDNVFRLGLTQKRVDVDESIFNLITQPAVIQRPHDSAASIDVREFRIDVHDGAALPERVPAGGPKIVIAVDGGGEVSLESETLQLGQGQAAFVRDGQAPELRGTGTIAVVSVPGT